MAYNQTGYTPSNDLRIEVVISTQKPFDWIEFLTNPITLTTIGTVTGAIIAIVVVVKRRKTHKTSKKEVEKIEKALGWRK